MTEIRVQEPDNRLRACILQALQLFVSRYLWRLESAGNLRESKQMVDFGLTVCPIGKQPSWNIQPKKVEKDVDKQKYL